MSAAVTSSPTPQSASAALEALRGIKDKIQAQVPMVQGGYVDPLIRAVRDAELEDFACTTESGALFCATGMAQATGIPAVVITIAGPGATDLSGIYCARENRLPLIWLIGTVPAWRGGQGMVQDTTGEGWSLALESILHHRQVPRKNRLCLFATTARTPDALVEGVATAAATALRYRGPVAVIAPLDVQSAAPNPELERSSNRKAL